MSGTSSTTFSCTSHERGRLGAATPIGAADPTLPAADLATAAMPYAKLRISTHAFQPTFGACTMGPAAKSELYPRPIPTQGRWRKCGWACNSDQTQQDVPAARPTARSTDNATDRPDDPTYALPPFRPPTRPPARPSARQSRVLPVVRPAGRPTVYTRPHDRPSAFRPSGPFARPTNRPTLGLVSTSVSQDSTKIRHVLAVSMPWSITVGLRLTTFRMGISRQRPTTIEAVSKFGHPSAGNDQAWHGHGQMEETRTWADCGQFNSSCIRPCVGRV